MIPNYKTSPSPKKKLLALYLVLLAMVFCGIAALQRCSVPTENSTHETLRIGIVYSPEGYYKSGDSINGFSHDLLTSISQNEDIKLEFIPISDIENSLSLLTKGKLDIIAALPSDSELMSNFLLSKPVGFQRIILIQNSYLPKCRSWFDLSHQVTHCEPGLRLTHPLSKINKAIGDTITLCEHPELSGENICTKVDNGEYNYALIQELYADKYLSSCKNVELVPRLSFTRTVHFIVSPTDSTLLKRLNLLISKYSFASNLH